VHFLVSFLESLPRNLLEMLVMSQKKIRIGIVGAGANTRLRHIPGFRAIDGVEVVGLVNRSAESSQRVAKEFGVPKTYPDWQALVADPDVDAVMIGTWPYLHCDVACAALAAGKHVLTEARMAATAAEARKMLAASQANPKLVAQVVPSPFGLESGARVRSLIDDHFLGEMREVIVLCADDAVWDYSKPLHWRQDKRLSGVNIMALGILHETAMRWIPAVERLYAQTTIFEPTRPDLDAGHQVPVTVPESVQIVTQHAGGVRGIYHCSGVEICGPGKQIHMYGSRGTIKVEFGATEKVFVAHHDGGGLKELPIPAELKGGWRVEAEFIGAIRGEETVKFTDFETGVKYMEFTEAVGISAERALPISLPL
jgi:predicted dehydrogenase